MSVITRVNPEVFIPIANHVSTQIVAFDVANFSSAGGFLEYLCEANDGIEIQVEIGHVAFYSLNNNILTAMINRSERQQLLTTGTIESTWEISPTNPTIVTVTIDSSLTNIAGYPRLTINIHNLGRQLMLA